jgi:hypothetical protein
MGRLDDALPWVLLAAYGLSVWMGFVATETGSYGWAAGFAALAAFFVVFLVVVEERRGR